MLSILEVSNLTPEQVLDYLPQLSDLPLDFFDASFVMEAAQNPERFRTQSRSDLIRSIIMRERHRLERIESEFSSTDSIVGDLSSRYGSIQEWARTFVESMSVDGRRLIQMPMEGLEVEAVPRSLSRRKQWEMAFLQEDPAESILEELSPLEEANQNYHGISVQEDRIGNMGHTLKAIAEMIPAGFLGVHFVDDKPYNLVLRPKSENDPRRRLLLGDGWFEVRKMPAVLWSAPSLENYNSLLDSGIEFTMSSRAENWLFSIDPAYDSRLDFEEGCPLFDFQQDAVNFLSTRDRAMLSLSPGLGKTLTSAYAAGIRNRLTHDVRKILLVCPASLLHYWKGELEKWKDVLPYKPLVSIWHKEVGRLSVAIPEGYQHWVITNPETVVKFAVFFEGRFDLLIADESIMYKHRDSKRSQVMNTIARSTTKIWLLTGAPATRYLDDMWHQFHILDNRRYSSYWRFAGRYCVVEETPWAKQVLANKRRAEEEIKENFADVYFARNQDQVANIPDWLFEDLDIAMKPKQQAIYEKLRNDLLIKLDGMGDEEYITVNNRLSLILRSLQVASNPLLLGSENSSGKWSALPELMDIYPGPFIVWVNFIRTGEMIQDTLLDKFGSDSVRLANGSTTMQERNTIVDNFQAGKYKAIVLNNTVGKFGFTITKARTAFFLERDYNDSYFQCLHRNRRLGTTQSPVIVNMRSVTSYGGSTIDHVVHDALDYRNGMIKKVTIGDIRRVLER